MTGEVRERVATCRYCNNTKIVFIHVEREFELDDWVCGRCQFLGSLNIDEEYAEGDPETDEVLDTVICPRCGGEDLTAIYIYYLATRRLRTVNGRRIIIVSRPPDSVDPSGNMTAMCNSCERILYEFTVELQE